MNNKKTAIILGATGLTGSYLLNMLLDSYKYNKIIVFTRRSLEIDNEKLEEIICDLTKLEKVKDKFFADEVYVCIGTTRSKTPNKDEYYKIDYGIPVSSAKLSSENNIKSFSVISSIGANKCSNIFYSRTKGEMENKVLEYDIENILIHRPSLIIGNRKDNRLGEKIAYLLFKLLNIFLIRSLKKYRYINGENLAKKIFESAQKEKGKKIIYAWE